MFVGKPSIMSLPGSLPNGISFYLNWSLISFVILERAAGKYRFLVGHIATPVNIGILLEGKIRITNG